MEGGQGEVHGVGATAASIERKAQKPAGSGLRQEAAHAVESERGGGGRMVNLRRRNRESSKSRRGRGGHLSTRSGGKKSAAL